MIDAIVIINFQQNGFLPNAETKQNICSSFLYAFVFVYGFLKN